MDITTITSAYTTIKNIKEITKVALDAKIDAEVSKQIQESLSKLGDVQDALFYIREELLLQQEEKEQLKKEIARLNEELEKRESVTYKAPSYWIIKEGEADDGPFCQRCFDDEQKLVRLQGGYNDLWACRKCNSNYRGPNYVSPPKRTRHSSWIV